MLPSVERIVKNLEQGIELVKAQPEHLLKLHAFRDVDHPCGTAFCIAGLMATHPFYNEQGMCFNDGHWVQVYSRDIEDTVETNRMFGPNAYMNVFFAYGQGERDQELFPGIDSSRGGRHAIPINPTEKELAIARLEAQIALVKALDTHHGEDVNG